MKNKYIYINRCVLSGLYTVIVWFCDFFLNVFYHFVVSKGQTMELYSTVIPLILQSWNVGNKIYILIAWHLSKAFLNNTTPIVIFH